MEESHTASTIISFAGKLEDESSRFYKDLAEKFVKIKETFLAFLKRARRTKCW